MYTPEMIGSGQRGVCVKCRKDPTAEGHDGCMGTIPGPVMNACCGHGDDALAYVQFWNGIRISGDTALWYINRKINRLIGERGYIEMKKESVEKANNLLRQKETLEKALMASFISKLETDKDWNNGSAIYSYNKRMVLAKHTCVDVCEVMMRNEAKQCIAEIEQELCSLGVDL